MRRHLPSPTTILLRHQLQKIGILDWESKPIPWTPNQILDLCRILKITTEDLGSMCAISSSVMKRYMNGNMKPGAPVCLHFHLIRQWAIERKFGTVVRPVFVECGLDLMTQIV